MRSRARLYDLYAQREFARVAGLGRAMTQVISELADAKASAARLQRMSQETQVANGPLLAATLRARGLLTSELVEEADRQNHRVEHAQQEAERLRQAMTLHDRRRLFGQTAATNARAADAEAAEARAEAARPTQTRR